jgi:hypothetical protein
MAEPRQYRGGPKPATKCCRGHRLTPANTVKAGKANNPRCRICRNRIVKASRKRLAKKKKAEAGNG